MLSFQPENGKRNRGGHADVDADHSRLDVMPVACDRSSTLGKDPFLKRRRLTMWIASSSVSARITPRTGPNTCSGTIVISGDAWSRIVGPNESAFSRQSAGVRPSGRSEALSALPRSIHTWERFRIVHERFSYAERQSCM